MTFESQFSHLKCELICVWMGRIRQDHYSGDSSFDQCVIVAKPGGYCKLENNGTRCSNASHTSIQWHDFLSERASNNFKCCFFLPLLTGSGKSSVWVMHSWARHRGLTCSRCQPLQICSFALLSKSFEASLVAWEPSRLGDLKCPRRPWALSERTGARLYSRFGVTIVYMKLGLTTVACC